MEQMKISVIGVGHLGKIHSKLWKNQSYAELIGVYDINQDLANSIANELDCIAFKSLDEAIDNSNAVTIAVPTISHFEVAKRFIRQNIHCLIEKPITETYQEAIELIELAKEKNVIIQVGHVERFNPALYSIKSFLDNPRFIEVHRLSQYKPRAIDVSVIHDLMIHDIDIVLWLVKSEISNIDANGVSIITDTFDIANARLKFNNGAVANLTASRISATPMRKMRIFQPNSYISLDFANQNVDVYFISEDNDISIPNAELASKLGMIEAGLKNKNIYYCKPKVEQINAIAEEQRAFIDAILNKQPVAVSAKEAARALKIAEDISSIISH